MTAIETRRFDNRDQILETKERGGISILLRDAGHCISGRLAVRMIDTGVETHIRAGDFLGTPPGHDAHVDGAETAELILFAPPEHRQ